MSLYELLKFLHILAAMVWVGGGIVLQIVSLRLARARDQERVLQFVREMEAMGPRVFAPASLAVLGLGIWMVLLNDAWAFSQLWIVLALAGFGLTLAIGIGYFGPWGKRLEAAVEAEGPGGQTVQRLIRQSLVVAWLDVPILVFIVWDMVAKPGL